MTRVGVVVPCGPGRGDNIHKTVAAIGAQTVKPHDVIVVFDGQEAVVDLPDFARGHVIPRHVPGSELYYNVGARNLDPTCEAVWFLDSDILTTPVALEELLKLWRPGRIVCGAYDWLPPDVREPDPSLRNDPRWDKLDEPKWDDPGFAETDHLNVGLACLSGNLLWDLAEFKRLGGFWNELRRGYDGELGLRAVAAGIPITFARRARGWHLWHPVDGMLIAEQNARDIPMIDRRHPWCPWLLAPGTITAPGIDPEAPPEMLGAHFWTTCPQCLRSLDTTEYWAHVDWCQ